MKKAISLLVALAAVLSLSVTAIASDDIPDSYGRTATYETAVPRINLSGSNNDRVVGAHELFLVDSANKVVGVYDKLDPDTEYRFSIYWNNSSTSLTNPDPKATSTQLTELTGKMLEGGNLRLRTMRGSSHIQSARINTIGRNDAARYELVVKTRATYGTKLNEVEFNLNVTGNKDNTFNESTHMFEVGFEAISDNETDIGEGGYITISNDYPVITKDQFVDIAKSVNYKNVVFEAEDGGWRFTGRVSGMGDTNFHYTYNVVPELLNRFPDQEYKFLTFNSGVTFPSTGEMRIDVSDIYDDFGTMYAYLYRNGKLTEIDNTYDATNNEIVFRTNYLGSFVITDKRITDTTIVAPGTSEEEDDEDDDNVAGEGSGNPNTGAGSAMNLAVTLGLASLVTAGAVSRKKK